jgi:membrane-associated phospholipid phosphatase
MLALLAWVGIASAAAEQTWFDYSRPSQVSLAMPPDLSQGAAQERDARETARLPDEWTHETLRLIVKYQLNPLRASRVLAYVHAAMDDARRLGAGAGLDEGALGVAQHRSASATLAYFFPQEPIDRIEGLGFILCIRQARASGLEKSQAAKAWLVGNQVAGAAIARARDDGGDATWNPKDRPAAAPQTWRATPPLLVFNPAEPLAGRWTTWVLRDGSEVLATPPPPFESTAYLREMQEVRDVSASLTPRQKRIAEDWNLDLGTVSPAGVWNRIALDAATAARLDSGAATRMLATLNAAIADAFIGCWHAKFTWWTVRPISVIHDRVDPEFRPLIVTPAFPSYPSGHATISGAASTVLGHFFPARRAEFRAMAEEAAISRLYGGIHFASDNENGLELGRRIGEIAVERRGAQAAR